MKNLNNEDKPNFEKHWEDAFKEAELEPSEDVWLKIDSALANQESNGLKRTIIFYRYAAAVSLLLLLSTAVVSLYIFNEDSISSGDLSKHSHESEEYVIHSPNSDPGIALHNNDVNEALINENNNSEEITHHDNKDNIKADENTFLSSEEQADRENGSLKNIIRNKSLAVDKEASQFSSHSGENLNNVIKPDTEKDETGSYGGGINEYQPLNLIASKAFEPITTQFNKLQKEIYGVPVKNAKEKKDEKSVSANGLFAGIQFTPGYFDPNIQMNKGNAALSANRAAFSQMGVNPTNQEQDLQPQMSYTYGLNFGVKVAKRWLVNMGLQYAKNNTSGTTQQFFHNEDNSMRILATPTTLNLVNESTADVAFNGAPYSMNSIDLNNNFEFASIPIKAGFIIIDKKISWIISTGVASDFLIKNEIQDQASNFDKVVIKPGESSPFRKLFFNGLASSEVIYHFTKNYSISIEPSFRTALNSFSKTESMISSHPQTFGIAAGFRYSF